MTMRIYKIHPGRGIDSLELHNVRPRTPGADEVRVRVRAASLNYRDLMVAKGTYLVSGDQAVVPMSDASGEVVEVGSAVTRFKTGDRVITSFFPNWIDGEPTPEKTAGALGAGADGVLAEELVLNERAFVRIPNGLDDVEASTLTCAGLTAWNSFFQSAHLRPGDSVLLLGTGGVSIWALQLAKAAGLRSIITSSNDAKLSRASALGADATINYRSNPEWQDEVLRLTDGRGVDLVMEVGGAGTFARSVSCTRMGGSVAVIGGVSGFGGEFRPFDLIGGARKMIGIFVGNRTGLEQLVRFTDLAGIHPVVDRVFAFDEAREAYAHLESGQHFGKVVIRVADH
ncbi:MAG TPA: NAD(P)-dependent alcohol dehydrogenase [Parasulfuritortus sp.]